MAITHDNGPFATDDRRRSVLLAARSYIAHALLLPWAFVSPFAYFSLSNFLKWLFPPAILDAQGADLAAGVIVGGSVMVLIVLCLFFREAGHSKNAGAKGSIYGTLIGAEPTIHGVSGVGDFSPRIFVFVAKHSATSWIYIALAVSIAGFGYDMATDGVTALQVTAALLVTAVVEAFLYMFYRFEVRHRLKATRGKDDRG